MTEFIKKIRADRSFGSVSVVGAGLIGCSWAIVFARAGWQVTLQDIDLAKLQGAPKVLAAQLRMLEHHDLCADPAEILARISYESDLKTAVCEVDYVQECGPEVLALKQELFSELDALTPPETILASSTSGLMASQFSAHLAGRHRALVAHPVNPPHLVPVVEISPSEWTDPEIVRVVVDVMTVVGQTPVTVQKEIPGFLLNRLQGALLNEALRLAQGGFATVEDIDKTVRDGLGLRWSFMGPFETIDLNAPGGLADYAKRYGPMYRDMAQDQAAPADWAEEAMTPLHDARRAELSIDAVASRHFWRDSRLAALAAHKQKREY